VIRDRWSPVDSGWRELAACKGRDTGVWFARDAFTVSVAVRICERCPVRVPCLRDALAMEVGSERFGVRGGLTAPERWVLADGGVGSVVGVQQPA